MCAVHCPAERWRTRLRSNVWRERTVTKTAHNIFDSVIDKYQTGVFSTTCDSPTDAISDCLNVDRVHRRFVAMSFILVDAVAYSWRFFVVLGVSIVHIFFISEQNRANITG